MYSSGNFPAPGQTAPTGTTPQGLTTEGQSSWYAMAAGTLDLWNRNQQMSPCWTGYNNHPLTPCPGTPDYEAIKRAIAKAPEEDIAALVNYLRTANSGRGPKSRVALLAPKCLPNWVKALMGGKDCVASLFPDAPAFLQDMVSRYGAPDPDSEPTFPEVFTAAGGSPLAALAVAGLVIWAVPKFLPMMGEGR